MKAKLLHIVVLARYEILLKLETYVDLVTNLILTILFK